MFFTLPKCYPMRFTACSSFDVVFALNFVLIAAFVDRRFLEWHVAKSVVGLNIVPGWLTVISNLVGGCVWTREFRCVSLFRGWTTRRVVYAINEYGKINTFFVDDDGVQIDAADGIQTKASRQQAAVSTQSRFTCVSFAGCGQVRPIDEYKFVGWQGCFYTHLAIVVLLVVLLSAKHGGAGFCSHSVNPCFSLCSQHF